MSLLQIKIDDKLKKAIEKKADEYGVPKSSIIRIVLVKSFLNNDNSRETGKGNIFNAERDNKGVGIDIDDFIERL